MYAMKIRILIRIAVIVSIVLLCTGFGVYSFLRMNAVENRQDFNLFTLVPQDATAVLETDRMADLKISTACIAARMSISCMYRNFLYA